MSAKCKGDKERRINKVWQLFWVIKGGVVVFVEYAVAKKNKKA